MDTGDSSTDISEIDWPLQCQLNEGALTQTPTSSLIIPYFANLAAKTLVNYYPENSKLYMKWYLDNLNMPDKWGLSGTIYDFRMSSKGTLVPTGKYDSADSYAATFLDLVSYYCEVTNDFDFIEQNMAAICKVADVIAALQDKDGLVFVKPKSGVKYLMDNCESYRGMMAWSNSLNNMGHLEIAGYYREIAEKIHEGIQSVLYDPEKCSYFWYYSRLIKRHARKGKWYPDGVSQLYLISSGILDPEHQAQEIWDQFTTAFSNWETGAKNDPFPWGNITLVANLMGDTETAWTYLRWAQQEYLNKGRPYPWYILESACYLELESKLNHEHR